MSHHPEKAPAPQQQVPSRGTNTSLASDDAIPNDTNDTSTILLERLQAWKHACGYLEEYVIATEKMHKANAKECEKLLKPISDPLKEGHHFDQSLGGIAGLFENIRFNTHGMASAHHETAAKIKTSILPNLERVHSEIKIKSKELHNGASKDAKAVDKSRNTTQKHIELLGQYTAGFDSAGGKVEPANDPYIIQRGVYHRLHKQVVDENNNRQDLIAVQNNFFQFEEHILHVFQTAISQFAQLVGGQGQSVHAMYNDMAATAHRIPPDFEWKGFVSRNKDSLIDPATPPRSIDSITFPNQNHRSTQPLVEGTLQRKGKIMKSYSTGYYVVTPAGFLHEFKDDDNFRRDPSPENSLYLPDCTVIAASDGTNESVTTSEFHVKGKDLSKGHMGNKLSLTREYAFRAHSAGEAAKWIAIISPLTKANSAANRNNSEPSSPVVSHPPVNDTNQQQLGTTPVQGNAPVQTTAPDQTAAPIQNTVPVHETKAPVQT